MDTMLSIRIKTISIRIKAINKKMEELFDWFVHEREANGHCCSIEQFFNKKYKKLQYKKIKLEKQLCDLQK